MPHRKPPVSRRGFLKTSAAATAVGALAAPAVHAAGSDTLKVALIGCGGRGSGAAANALQADPHTTLWAACDIFEDRLQNGLKNLRTKFKDRVAVAPERCFTGFDGYKQAIDSGVDVVILATTPGFRPLHLAYAVSKDKHVFMEKPHATDVAGAKSVIESARLAKSKGLGLVSGFCYRYDLPKRETLKRIHGGAIGDVLAVHSTYLTSELWHRGNDPKWSEMEQQIRNWYYYTWLSGDFIVEQAIHSIDKAAWVMNGALPVAAAAMGGRQVRTDPKWGNIYDHFSVVYEYDNGAKVFHQCRQMNGCPSNVNDHVIGSKGSAQLMQHAVTPAGGSRWAYEGDAPNMYDQEHNELFASIRAGKPLNDGETSAYSTLMGLMGREAAYSGQRVTWKQLLESNQSLQPKEYAWGSNPVHEVRLPGKYKFA